MNRKVITCLIVASLLGTLIGVAPVSAKKGVIRVPGDYSSIQEAVDAAGPGDIIMVGPGEYTGCKLYKPVTIKGTSETIISSGPMHPVGLSQGFRLFEGSEGSRFLNLVFTVDLVIMNGGSVDDVTVSHCRFLNPIQAVSNWGGSNWVITHNEVTDLRTRSGGGIGILLGDRFGGEVSGNLVAYNKVTGTLHVDPNDCGGYSGSGIVLYADFRWGMAGASMISDNVVKHNKVHLVSDTPDVVDVVGFELTDSRFYPDPDQDHEMVITDNTVMFNDFRGTATEIALTPEILDNCNTISRNHGDNRGHGAHPKGY